MDELGIRGVTGACDRNGRLEGPAIGVSGGSGAKRGSSRTYIHTLSTRTRAKSTTAGLTSAFARLLSNLS